MPVNRNALIRYKTIDKCLQNRYRKWTLEDLIDACSDALYEYEGIDKGVSRRSVQADIQMMRSDKLGYNAPIVVVDKKYYAYEDPHYSITNIPLTDQDLGKLGEAVEFLKQFQGFSHFRELDTMVQKLEDHIYAHKTHSAPVIDFEKNDHLKGLEYLDRLYQAIIHRKAILISYQSFKARQVSTFNFHPHLLKEFKNRWFVIGPREKEESMMVLALDRIAGIQESRMHYREQFDFNPATYFRDVIGVSVNPGVPPERVLLFVNHRHAPYVLTKPLHHSQRLVEKNGYGVVISLDVQLNFELEKEILGFGEAMRVLAPERLKRTLQERISEAMELYQSQLDESGLTNTQFKLRRTGSAILQRVYTGREVRRMLSLLHNYMNEQAGDMHARRNILTELPILQNTLFNQNLLRIVRMIDPAAFLVNATYFDKSAQANWQVNWHQDQTIAVKEKTNSKGYSGWTRKKGYYSVIPPLEVLQNMFTLRIHLDDTGESNGALRIVHGSHNKRLSDEEIRLITTNSMPVTCTIPSGGVHIMRPLLLHTSAKSDPPKRRRVLHLEFASLPLPGKTEWAFAISLPKE